jgi:hypothetical protein
VFVRIVAECVFGEINSDTSVCFGSIYLVAISIEAIAKTVWQLLYTCRQLNHLASNKDDTYPSLFFSSSCAPMHYNIFPGGSIATVFSLSLPRHDYCRDL